MKRVKTNIKGFDNLIEGGFPENSLNLLTGDAGTGKTIFSIEYLYNLATIEKQNCIYFTFEEKKESLFQQAEQFGWNLEKLANKKKGFLKIISIKHESIDKNTVRDLIEIITNTKATNIVIDSISTLAFLVPKNNFNVGSDENEIRKFIYLFITKLKSISKLTGLIISQKDSIISNSIAKYICDGVIEIEYESMGGDYSRTLLIKKMRKTKNDEEIHPMEISNNGIKLHNLNGEY